MNEFARLAFAPDSMEENLLARILDSYREAMKLEVRVFPINGKEGVASIEGPGHPFCCAMRSCPPGMMNCLKDVNRAIRVSVDTGEPYIYQCHSGLVEFAAALGAGGAKATAFICGPILLRQPDAFIQQHIISRIKKLPLDQTMLMELLPRIPVYTERRVQAAADLLFLIASYVSRAESALTQQQRLEISREQSLLAEGLFLSKTLVPDEEEPMLRAPGARRDFYREKELVDLIKIGNRKKARALLDEILGPALFRSREHLGILKARALEIVFVIARAAVEAGANLEEILGFQYQCVQNLSRDDSEESLYYFLVKAFDQLFQCIYQNRNIQHTAVFTKAKQYIWNNYSQKLTLKKLAAAVGISPFYLSRLFRKEMGASYLEYLTSVRISVAKTLLKQTRMSIMDICLEVGYQDPSHFSSIFSEKEGIHPKEYRKRLHSH